MALKSLSHVICKAITSYKKRARRGLQRCPLLAFFIALNSARENPKEAVSRLSLHHTAGCAYNIYRGRSSHSVYIQLKELRYPSSDPAKLGPLFLKRDNLPLQAGSHIVDGCTPEVLEKERSFSDEYYLDCGR
jgi:hypothetical protein